MPQYDYKCKDCKTAFSISASFTSMLGCKPSCPCCKGENIEKIYSAPNIIFKGSGFYNTDNKKEEKNGN
jgi:putative FmdB family regulatory protein